MVITFLWQVVACFSSLALISLSPDKNATFSFKVLFAMEVEDTRSALPEDLQEFDTVRILLLLAHENGTIDDVELLLFFFFTWMKAKRVMVHDLNTSIFLLSTLT